jgi:hypothetical protein
VRRQKAVEKRVIKFVHLDATRLWVIALVIIRAIHDSRDSRIDDPALRVWRRQFISNLGI